MGFILKFRSPNVHTIVTVTKIKKGFFKKKESFCFLYFLFSYFIYMLWFKQVESANKVLIGLWCFLIILILKTVNMSFIIFSIQTQNGRTLCMHKEKICEENNFCLFFKVNFILIFFQLRLASFVNAGKPLSHNLQC